MRTGEWLLIVCACQVISGLIAHGRLFDSQNNNRGGYNVGNLYYYEGSILPIEWTNQHSCADQNSHCEVIMQYMCDDRLRDGSTTK